MTSAFECAWESVRPVPRVTIDFGDGRTLERTLHGNVVTYFCTSNGEVFDLVPGLVDAQEYLRRLDQAMRLSRYFRLAPLLAMEEGTSEPTGDPAHGLLTDWHRALVALRESDVPLDRDPVPVPDHSKFFVERRLDDALLPPLAARDAESLRLDTLHNRLHRYPLASELWLEHPHVRPGEITLEVYRRLLGVDLDDPYLGLAPDVLGGELGRHGPSSAGAAQ